jgi:hypothetical protein
MVTGCRHLALIKMMRHRKEGNGVVTFTSRTTFPHQCLKQSANAREKQCLPSKNSLDVKLEHHHPAVVQAFYHSFSWSWTFTIES